MKRLLAIILASLLILSSATAGASAYQAYKDDALTKYDFTDTAVLTTEQYASALLDYADKALAKENITMDLSILGKLDATSIDNALSSVYKLINGNKIILWMAGDLNSVNVDAIKNPRRSNTTDVAVIKALLQFLADNKGIVKKVVVGGVGKYKRDGGVSLGVANSFVKVDLNVEVMLREMIWGLAYPNTEYTSSNNIDSMLQVKQKEFEAIKNKYTFEKNEEYQKIGNYFWPTQTVEKNLHRSFLRFQVNEQGVMTLTSIYCGPSNIHHVAVKVIAPDGSFAETPASNDSYETTDLGEKIEKADYKMGEDGNVLSFLYMNRDKKNIRVEYLGERKFSTTMTPSDREALVGTYELAKLLSSIRQIQQEKEEANLKIEFVKRKMEQKAQEEAAEKQR